MRWMFWRVKSGGDMGFRIQAGASAVTPFRQITGTKRDDFRQRPSGRKDEQGLICPTIGPGVSFRQGLERADPFQTGPKKKCLKSMV